MAESTPKRAKQSQTPTDFRGKAEEVRTSVREVLMSAWILINSLEEAMRTLQELKNLDSRDGFGIVPTTVQEQSAVAPESSIQDGVELVGQKREALKNFQNVELMNAELKIDDFMSFLGEQRELSSDSATLQIIDNVRSVIEGSFMEVDSINTKIISVCVEAEEHLTGPFSVV
jgi:hypothetical protein